VVAPLRSVSVVDKISLLRRKLELLTINNQHDVPVIFCDGHRKSSLYPNVIVDVGGGEIRKESNLYRIATKKRCIK